MDIEVKLDQDVVDLAPSADAAVMWWFDLTTDSATWMPGMADLLGVPDEADTEIRARLVSLVEAVVVAARTASVWQDFALKQPCSLPDGTMWWIQLQACVSGDAAAKSLTGVDYDEQGARLPESEYPCVQTPRTGLPHNGRVVRLRRADGQDIWLSLSCGPLNQVNTYPAYVVISFTDITERKSIAARLDHGATHDGLTGLANRTLVIRHLSARTGAMAVLFVDLDKFKVINDSLGHAVGDKVLRIIGERLRKNVRGGDLVGRLGGDEFVVVARDISQDDVRGLAGHLRDAVAAPVSVDGRQLHLDASIGIVVTGPGDSRTGEDLLRDSDVAMYQAKSQGRGRYMFFDVELREKMQRRLQLEGTSNTQCR